MLTITLTISRKEQHCHPKTGSELQKTFPSLQFYNIGWRCSLGRKKELGMLITLFEQFSAQGVTETSDFEIFVRIKIYISVHAENT